MKIIQLSAVFILLSIFAQSQNLIGSDEQEIRKYMKDNLKEMNYNNVINSQFKYLKYSDNSDNQTILFFLNNDSVCKDVRIICDVSMKPKKVKEFNAKYDKDGDNKWIEKKNGKEYIIEIVDGMWSCVISIKPKK